MPGIHVRSLGRLHWEDSNKEAALTVPGSYWLCHKNNIYKFEFKFHKTVRSTEKFTYTKELMKIIRRVIKWKPRQGQNFGTTNLLVTYNHVSWTRQDKMFAVMKFCDRPNAVAFPHAFTLTVKIVDTDQQTKENMGNSSTKTDIEKSAKSSSAGEFSLDRLTTENLPAEDEDIASTHNTESSNGHDEKEKKSKESWFFRVRSRLKESDENQSSSTDRCADSSEQCADATNSGSEKIDADSSSEKNNADDSTNCSWVDDSEEMPALDSAPEQKDNDERQTPIVDEDDNSSSSDDTNSDDSSLPYQYLLERDIERENSRNAKRLSEQKNLETEVVVDEPCDPVVSSNSSNSNFSQDLPKTKIRSRQDSRDSDSLPPDVTNLRSSNITDLVMKGLMFTIRQDKDTVTVVEQKTKLEVDEVLENSEKVETKEGDPCLLNSSLLRLEKMITRMQQPASLPESPNGMPPENALVSFIDLADEMRMKAEGKFNEADTAERKEMCGDLETANYWSNFLTDKDFMDSNFENLEKTSKDDFLDFLENNQDEDLILRMESSEEEEDIIPEAILSGKFLPKNLEDLSKMSSSVNVFEDSSSGNANKVCDEKISDEKSNSNQPDSSSTLNGSHKDFSKRLKILSNQIITNDQIPPVLLKAMKKPSNQQQQDSSNDTLSDEEEDFSLNNNSKTNGESIDKIENSFSDPKVDSIISNSSELENIKNTESIVEKEVVSEISSENSEIESNLDNEISDSLSGDKLNNQNVSKRITRSNSNVSSSNSSSSLLDKTRRMRSNSKLYEKILQSESAKSLLKSEFTPKIRSQRTSYKETSEVLSNPTGNKKRRNSTQDQTVTKFLKHDECREFEKKDDVQINVSKLLNDLTYGFKIVIERLDMRSIQS